MTKGKLEQGIEEMKKDIIQHLINRPKRIDHQWFEWESQLESKLFAWLGSLEEVKK